MSQLDLHSCDEQKLKIPPNALKLASTSLPRFLTFFRSPPWATSLNSSWRNLPRCCQLTIYKRKQYAKNPAKKTQQKTQRNTRKKRRAAAVTTYK